MCNCVSCEYTDSFAAKGFDAWPKGEPKGPRRAKAEYAAHVSFGKQGLAAGWTFTPDAAPHFAPLGFVPPARMPKLAYEILARGSIINEFQSTEV